MRFFPMPLALCMAAILNVATSNLAPSYDAHILLRRSPTKPQDQHRLAPTNLQRSPPRQAQPNILGSGSQGRSGSPTKSAELRIAEEQARRARRLRRQAQRAVPPGMKNDDRLLRQSVRHEGIRHQDLANAYDKAAQAARAAGRPDRVQRNELKSASAKAGVRTMAAWMNAVQTSYHPRTMQRVTQSLATWDQSRNAGGKDTDSSSQGSEYASSSSSASESPEISG